MTRRHYEKPQMQVKEIETCLMLAASNSLKARTEKLDEEEEAVWE